ncbi:MAG: glycosyltransferase family 2 protein [Candidatus Omnitrophica bacterium]|nr:glycosyltransferase family 2 protein [Candidatus Omnitrophota bacterium]
MASPSPGDFSPVCDVVLLTWNQLELLQPCVESILKNTTVPIRLMIVDNGSEAPTKEYLSRVKGNDLVRIEVLTNESNLGFVGGMNRGMNESTGPYVCLLNNDTLVTPGWMREMLAVAESSPEIGIVNPASSTFGEFPPEGMSLDDYGRSLASKHGHYVEVGECIGFAMTISRAVLDKIGVLDTGMNRIFFEDTDYCRRATMAGFRCVVASASYVFHHEHKSFKLMPEKEQLFRENQQRFWKKWGKPVRIAWYCDSDPATDPESMKLVLSRAVEWARQNAYVHVFYPQSRKWNRHQLFDALGLREHANVGPYGVPAVWARLYYPWRILSKRKKPYDWAYSDVPAHISTLKGIKSLHSAQVALWSPDKTKETIPWKEETENSLSRS